MSTLACRVGIIDYGMGNLASVMHALESIEADASIIGRPDELAGSSHIVLPGVGAFGDGMANLVSGGWVDALERHVRSEGRPLLGLCLGMQLMARMSTEAGEHTGLGWLDGVVDRLPAGPEVRIPHIGWNDVEISVAHPVLRDLPDPPDFYFVHSYAYPADGAGAVATCEHGVRFAAACAVGSAFGVQFHPEKSHRTGIALLRNFVGWDGRPC